MSAFVFFFNILIILSGLLCLILGLYILAKSRASLNILYFLLTFSLFLSALFSSLMRISDSSSQAYFWFYLAQFAWLAVFATALHFFFILAEFKPKWLGLIYLPPLAVYWFLILSPDYISGFSSYKYGMDFLPGPNFPLYIIFYLSYMLTGIFMVFWINKSAREFYRRKQALIIFWSAVLPVFLGTIFDTLLKYLRLPTLPLTIQTTTLTIGFIGYAILRYAPVNEASKKRIAEAVAEALQDGLFLTDENGTINYANAAACRLSMFPADELLGKSISAILAHPLEANSNMIRKDRTVIQVEQERTSLASGKGFLYMTRDLSEQIKTQETISDLTMEQKEVIGREKKVVELLFRFMEFDEVMQVEAIWQEIQSQNPQIQPTLKPVYDLAKIYTLALEQRVKARDNLSAKKLELEKLNSYMQGRDSALAELQKKRDELRNRQA